MTRGLSAGRTLSTCSLYLRLRNAVALHAVFGRDALEAVGLELARRLNLFAGGIEGGFVEMLDDGGLAIHRIELEEAFARASFAEGVLLALSEEPILHSNGFVIASLSAHYIDDDALVSRVAEEFTLRKLHPGILGRYERDRWMLDMRQAVDIYKAISAAGVCTALEPVASGPGAEQFLFQVCHLYIGGTERSPGIALANEFLPSLRRLRLLDRIDVLSANETINRLRENPVLVLACTISASSAVVDARWHSVFAQLADDQHLANRLVFSFRDLEDIEDVEAAVSFTTALKAYGCKIAIDYSGSSVGAMSFLVAARPDIVTINAISTEPDRLARLAERAEGQINIEQAFQFARHLALHVVVAGVENQSCWESMRQMGAEWFQGDFIGVPCLFSTSGKFGRHDRANNKADVSDGTNHEWWRLSERVALTRGAFRVGGGMC